MLENTGNTIDGLPCPPEEIDAFISRPTAGVLKTAEKIKGDVMILGAAGKMGFHLSLMLKNAFRELGRSNQVVAVSRFSTLVDKDQFHQNDIKTIACDLSLEEQVKALPQAEDVFFMAGVKFGTSSAPELLRKMNIEMPQLVVEQYRKSRIVAYSTGCVYKFVPVDSGGATEASPVGGPGEYAQSCIGREQAFIDGSNRFGTRCSLIRLNYSIDLRYGVLLDVAKKVFAGEPIDVSMGYVNVVWQGDAIAYSIQSLDHAASPPFILNVTGPETVAVRWLAEEFGQRFGKEAEVFGTEETTAWLNNPSKSHRMMGTPAVTLPQMIDWVAAWVRHGGKTWNKPTHFENREGKY